MMTSPRDVLNELKWRHHALADAHVLYRHRGAPGDVRDVSGRDILDLGRSFFERRTRHGSASIPYHRVLAIEAEGRTLWKRTKAGSEAPPSR